MPLNKTIEAANKDKAEGKSASTQAGEFVREEIEKIRGGEHGARSAKQAIAIGLSEARRAGVALKPPAKGKYSDEVRHKAVHDLQRGKEDPHHKPDPKRSEASIEALRKESTDSVSHQALSRQAKSAAKSRTKNDRSAAAQKGAQTRTPQQRSESARKAAETRKKNRESGG